MIRDQRWWLLTVVAAGCARDIDPERLLAHGLRPDIPGCYRLLDPADRPIDSTYYNAARVVHLKAVPDGDAMYRQLRRIGDDGRYSDRDTIPFASPTWSADSLTDSIHLSFTDGHSGAAFVLNVPRQDRADTIRGRAYETWDVGPTVTSRGKAAAVRVECPTASRPSAG